MSRKELLKREDAFLSVAGRAMAWVKQHGKGIGALFVLVFIVIVAVWVVIESAERRLLEASKLYGAALEVKVAEVTAEAASPTSTPPTFASEQERALAAREAFERVIAAAPKSGVADLARLYVADLCLELGERDKALNLFRALAAKGAADDSLHFVAVERTAYLLELMGDKDAAVKMWEAQARSHKLFYADRALLQIARLHAEKQENDKAQAALARLTKDFPNSSLKREIDELYARVGRPEDVATDGAPSSPTP